MGMRIGIDDTDSPEGMCTTYLGAVLIRRLSDEGFTVNGQTLVRLNPNVPYKTRGNAAVSIEAEGGSLERAFELACAAVEEFADFSCEKTNPGVVVNAGSVSTAFYKKALRGFCEISEATDLLRGAGALYKGWKLGRGLIGATAAISADLPDYTYELLTYRDHRDHGLRQVERESVFSAEAATWPHTWDSVDRENNVVVCVPHTPDPVIYGIRGESPKWVEKAASLIKSEEPIIRQVYRTNQGTDAHLIVATIADMKDGRSYHVAGTVAAEPETRRGGHVVLRISDGPAAEVVCMAYEPTKGFRDVVRTLLPGDRIEVCGSFKRGRINLEKLRIVTIAEVFQERPPVCTECGKRMTSAGFEKGYKCRHCGAHAHKSERRFISRTTNTGWYEVPPSARRHLAKPLARGMLSLHQS